METRLADILEDPETWLETPNPLFNYRKPADLVGTLDEKLIWDWISAVENGFPT